MGVHVDSSDVLAIVALVVALVSFMTTAPQVLQQYLASADGYRRCQKSVMGLWYEGTHRVFRPRELRFEVTFETPVFFLSRPENKKGPMGMSDDREIYIIDGSDKSYEKTRTMGETEQKNQDRHELKSVHTVDDERASWVNLLSKLQSMERESEMGKPKARYSAWHQLPPVARQDHLCTIAEAKKVMGFYASGRH